MLLFRFYTVFFRATICGTMLCAMAAASAAGASVDFDREIRPIFADRCVNCHGGLEKKGGLSLIDGPEGLKTTKSGRAAIIPGAPSESELLRRVEASDPEERMPRKGEGLPPEAVARLKEWILHGAPWPQPWAYRELAPLGPRPDEGIDRLVVNGIVGHHLSPAPPAAAAVLLRRVSLDLIGLPPNPDEIDAFAADHSDRAYEATVNRLLGSPRFGERWASAWLDLARYADTQGYEKDNLRTIWAYRDWVIQAFNDDLPFDQFTVEQIAGDLLPKATVDQQVATAFHRNTMTNTEGGTDQEEFRVKAVIDRVNTTWAAWMGLSFGCAQCHDHPYEPITQREYYEFLAFFNNTEDSNQGDDRPTLTVLPLTERAKANTMTARANTLRSELSTLEREWAAQLSAAGKGEWNTLPIDEMKGSGDEALKRDGSGAVTAGAQTEHPVSRIVSGSLNSERITAVRVEALGGDISASTEQPLSVLSHLDVALLLPSGRERPITLMEPEADACADGFAVADAIGRATRNRHGWGVRLGGDERARATFPLAEPITVPPGARLRVTLDHSFEDPQGARGFAFRRFRIALSSSPRWTMKAHPPAVLAKLREDLRETTAAIEGLKETTVPIMRELPSSESRATRVFRRGNWLDAAEPVSPGTPRAFPPLAPAWPRNRLGLARWLVSPQNPLTARVLVNRIWREIFGAGLVNGTEGFSAMSAPPEQEPLLDWLASKFQGEWSWSVKRLLKEIVLSATYRQSADASPEIRARDPENRWLARGPRFRLPAEMIRDQALAAAGLLSPRLYGPSVMPPQPEGVWQVVYSAQRWVPSPGENRHRRALYTFWRRTSPYPSLALFDAPTRETCTASRPRSDTPTAALAMMNDPAYTEAATALGRRMMSEGGGTIEARIRYGWKLLLAGAPSEQSLGALARLLHRAEPQTGAEPGLQAYAIAASALLNLDAALTKE